MIQEKLQEYRGRTDMRMDDLVRAAAETLPYIAPHQERPTVSRMPDARSVRYYMSQGILNKPHQYQGGAALFGYKHLLQLLAVKMLQAQYLPLKRIKSLIAEATSKDLERILRTGSGASEFLGLRDPTGVGALASVSRRRAWLESRARAPDPAEFLGEIGNLCLRSLHLGSIASSREIEEPVLKWERHLLAPGLEVHVREDFNPGSKPSDLSAMVESLLSILRHYGEKKKR